MVPAKGSFWRGNLGPGRDGATAADRGKARKIQRAQTPRGWDSPWALTPVRSSSLLLPWTPACSSQVRGSG